MLLNKKTQGVDVCEKGLENVNGHDRGFPSFFLPKKRQVCTRRGVSMIECEIKNSSFLTEILFRSSVFSVIS